MPQVKIIFRLVLPHIANRFPCLHNGELCLKGSKGWKVAQVILVAHDLINVFPLWLGLLLSVVTFSKVFSFCWQPFESISRRSLSNSLNLAKKLRHRRHFPGQIPWLLFTEETVNFQQQKKIIHNSLTLANFIFSSQSFQTLSLPGCVLIKSRPLFFHKPFTKMKENGSCTGLGNLHRLAKFRQQLVK